MPDNIKAVVLAAGKGTRLQTENNELPKVMRTVREKPLLWYVLEGISFIDKNDTIIVVGYMKEAVTEYFGGYAFAEQVEQLGTGHAVKAAKDQLVNFDGAVLVCCGDMPAIKRETYESFVRAHFDQMNACTILTGESSIQLSYGRIVRDDDGGFKEIVEDRDCTEEQRQITELNSGVYIFDCQKMLLALESLGNNNNQKEYYLTDVPAIMKDSGEQVGLYKRDLGDEIVGVNTMEQLLQVEEIIANREVG